MTTLKGTNITITGGTGSFGRIMAQELLRDGAKEIRILSRDENKQYEMRNEFKDERLKFFIGDVRDKNSIKTSIHGSDYVFHAAALKQVPSCEFFPMQALQTNVNGSANVIEVAIENKVKTVVCLSTDKAVYPMSAMGMSKALMEKVAQSYARNINNSETKIAITRYGNVMMSRGSVIPLFIQQISSNLPLTVTEPKMTRFLMSLSDSVSLVKYAFLNANTGDIFVKKSPGCSVATLVEALARIFKVNKLPPAQIIGIRHGEKIDEVLIGSEELIHAQDLGEFYRIPLDTRSLDYRIYFEKGTEKLSSITPYSSANTAQLTVDEVVKLLTNLPEFSKYMEQNGNE
jgi:UDP-glucose 4-epimerase